MKTTKGILSILVLYMIFFSAKGQNLVVLRGYVVMQFDRQEVMNRQTINNHSSTQIDSYKKSYFFPFGKLSLDDSIDSVNILHYDNIVFLPSKETNELISEFCKDKSYVIQNNASPNTDDLNYFEFKGNPKDQYLYKFYYAEYKAINTTIPNNSKNAFKLNILFNKSVSNLQCNFVFDTIILQGIQSINTKKIIPFNINQKLAPHEAGHMVPKN